MMALAAGKAENARQRALNANFLGTSKERANIEKTEAQKRNIPGYKDGNRRVKSVLLGETVMRSQHVKDFLEAG